MPHTRLLLALVCLGLPSVVACTNAPAAGDDIAVADGESELRALASNEVIGPIAFNATATVNHTGTPRYRAYSFSVTAGDKLDIWVRSATTDTHAWLVDESFRTIKFNNDANGSNEGEDDADTTDSNIKYEATKTGKYFIVFRGQLNVAANISVRVDKSGGPPPPPPVSENPWGCTDAALSAADLIARVPTGASTLSLLPAGGLRYEQRSRVCNQQTGCAAWSAVTPFAGNDGGVAKLGITTTDAGGVTFGVSSTSDSSGSFPLTNGGTITGSLHTPNHDTGAYEAKLTKSCVGTRMKMTQGTNGQGTWTELEFGFRTGMTPAITRVAEPVTNPWACTGTPLVQSEQLRRFTAGSDTLSLLSGGNQRYGTRTRSCNTLTGCAPWSAVTPYAGNDGGIATLNLQTTSAGGITLTIASTSDSSGTFTPATGRFSGSLHTPNHDTGTMEGSFAKDCTGYRMQTKTAPANGGSYTETEFGYQGDFPDPVR